VCVCVCEPTGTEQTCYICMLTNIMAVHNVMLVTDVCVMTFYFKHLIIFHVYITNIVTLMYRCNYKYIYVNITVVLHIALYSIS
jgi:hypothetical protein